MNDKEEDERIMNLIGCLVCAFGCVSVIDGMIHIPASDEIARRWIIEEKQRRERDGE